MLTVLNPIHSKKRGPGPGPIRKRDWAPIAKRKLQDRQVVLHTDGARAYKIKVPGVIHYNLVHQKRRATHGAKVFWQNPNFTKVVEHALPDGRTLHNQARTQVLDRFWAHLRSHLRFHGHRVGSKALARRIKSIQWTYWFRGADQLAATWQMPQWVLGSAT